ncbi:MAG: acyltransferase [Ahniella sp.]|nr:acyltransferase [Ahniella sp.]
MDWPRLFISRVLRLTPAYLLAVLLLFVLVAALSNFERQESWSDLAWNAWRWLTFTLRGDPPLNGDANTKFYVAGVTWTLVYEWYFYATLPVLAVLHGYRTPWWLVVFGVLIWFSFGWPWIGVLSFFGGFLAAWFRRSALERWVLANNRTASAISLAAMIATVSVFPGSFAWWPNLLLTVAFVPIALGADLFGLLRVRSAETLGTVSYSLYLMHGLMLGFWFFFVLGRDWTATFSLTEHWIALFALTPFLITLCVISYRWIERPAIDWVPAWTRAWRKRFGS